LTCIRQIFISYFSHCVVPDCNDEDRDRSGSCNGGIS